MVWLALTSPDLFVGPPTEPPCIRRSISLAAAWPMIAGLVMALVVGTLDRNLHVSNFTACVVLVDGFASYVAMRADISRHPPAPEVRLRVFQNQTRQHQHRIEQVSKTATINLTPAGPAKVTADLRVAAGAAPFEHPQALLELASGEARDSLLAVHGILGTALPPTRLRVYEAGGGSTSSLPLDVLRRAHVTVVDIDADQICNNDYAQETILGDVQSHRFAPESFDLVICYNVIEHLPDVDAAL